jgi:hypothetical protein
VKKLISIGLIVAILATILVTALTSGMPSDPWYPPPPPPMYSTEYFYHTGSTASIGAWVKATEGDNRELKWSVWANCAHEDWGINNLELVVALWSEGNPVLCRTYHHQEVIDSEVGYWTYTLSVKEDGMIDPPDYGLACLHASADNYNPWGYYFIPCVKTYAIKFINGAAPEIYEYPGRIPGRWSMYQTFQNFPSYYG